MRPSAAPVVGATLLSGVATACIVFVPSLHFAYRQHELHVGFETAAALIGLLAAYLLLGRFRQTHALHDLALFAAFSVFALVTIGFLRRAAERRDEFLAWLAVASVFAAFSRLNYFLYPSLYTEWVYSGDVFRLLFYATVLVAALREIASYWRAAAAAAVLEERRRIARDLHDGLAQELAFVRRNLNRLDPDDPVVAHTRRGADRALIEARRGIAVLTDDVDQPLDVLLAETAREVAEREGPSVALSLAPEVRVTPEQREALLRIVSEAITNAARHGDAKLVRVALEGGDRIRVRVTDTGSGFEPDAVNTRGHFGLASMRERAQALGGQVRTSSRPREGAEVEVVL